MELEKIRGSSYLIKAPTNIGVYVYKNKFCLLVDSGISNSQARKIDEVLAAAGLHPKYIVNTHSHTDHCGGNSYFRGSYPGLQVYASAKERIYMENPELLAISLYSGDPFPGIERERGSQPISVDLILQPGISKINDEKFEVLPLPGHSAGQIGLITPERVCFLGDAIFSREIIDKYSLPYLFDIGESIRTLNRIRDVDADYFIVSHAERVIGREELLQLIELNLNNLEAYRRQFLELLSQPLTREELVEHLTLLNDLKLNLTEYHLVFSVVSSFLTHLCRQRLIDYSIGDGRCYYFNKPQ